MSLVELLQNGNIEEFNTRRSARNGPDLFASELAGARMAQADLAGANLDKSDLTGSDLSGANLTRAFCSGIDGEDLDLSSAMALRVKMRDAYMERAILDEADFTRSDLSEAVLTGSRGECVRMCGARLKGLVAQEVRWRHADLTEANCKQADFTTADLRGADLSGARAANAIFDNARLDGAVAREAQFQGVKALHASLVGIRMDHANLAGADFTGANLEHADLTGVNLTGAVLVGARLVGASMTNACFDGADLTGADLTHADLTGVDPAMAGLSEEQVASVSSFGWAWDPDAALVFDRPAVGRIGKAVVTFWRNPEEGEGASIRWALCNGRKTRTGALPVAPDAMIVRAVVPRKEDFELVAVVARSSGYGVLRYPLGLDGTLGTPTITPLGYDPVVPPLIRTIANRMWIWGLARRGPTLVIHRDGDEGLGIVHSRAHATAIRFLSRDAPVLACKGGVLIAVDSVREGPPFRTPDGFPGLGGLAVPLADRIFAAWAEEPRGALRPGGLHSAWLSRRRPADPVPMAPGATILALDARTRGDAVQLVWLEDSADGPVARFAQLPDGKTKEIPLGEIEPKGIRLVTASETADPLVALTTADGALVVVNLAGKALASLGT